VPAQAVMNRKLTHEKKKWDLLLWPLLILLSVLFIIWAPNGLLHLRQLDLENQELIHKNVLLEKENYLLYDEISRLRHDPGAIEQLARQELGLVKEGELIFQFVTPSTKE
jgi:cell division protein FtsB